MNVSWLTTVSLVVFLLVAVPSVGQVITTFAGGGPVSGVAATSIAFEPHSVICDGASNCYVSAPKLNRILKIDPTGTVSTFAGTGGAGYSGDGGPATAALLSGPQGLALDPAGNLLVADTQNYRIRRVSASGNITTIAGFGISAHHGDGGIATFAGFSSPVGVAADQAGNLFVCDSGANRVRKINAAGVISTVAGGGSAIPGDGGDATAVQLIGPMGVASDQIGNLYFTEFEGNRVRKVTPAGVISTVAGTGVGGFSGDGGFGHLGQVRAPAGLAIGFDGSLFIADSGNHRIRRVLQTGTISTVAGGGTQALAGDGGSALQAQLSTPISVATAGDALFVGESRGYRIRRVTGGGTISTVAGNGSPTFAGDGGPANAAQLLRPEGLASAGNGAIYFADSGNGRIRRVGSNGVVETIAESPPSGPPWTLAGLASDPAGNVYFAAFTTGVLGGRVFRISPTGTASVFAGGGGNIFLPPIDGSAATTVYLSPIGLATDSIGNVYITDFGNSGWTRVRKVDSNGILTTVAGGGTTTYPDIGDGGPATSAIISSAKGIAADSNGNIYVAEHDRVRKVHASGIITTVLDGPLVQSASGVAVDGSGNLYVSVTGRILKLSNQGILSSIAGNGTPGFSGDGGPATSAQLYGGLGIATDSAGNVYFSDTLNDRIRKIEFPPTPAAQSLSPPATTASGPAFTLDVTGTSFTAQSIVRWNGADRSTTFVNATSIRAQILASDIATAGSAAVTVFTPGAGSSNALTFTTNPAPQQPPAAPTLPSPADTATNVSTTVSFTWTGQGATSYDVYFGTAATPPLVGTALTASYNPGTLAPVTTYFWRVVARNNSGTVTSAVWRFTTEQASPLLSGLRFVPVTPCRVADTRAGQGTTGNFGPPTLNPNTARELPIPSGRCNIPATARAYAFNVTVVPQGPLGYLTLWPTGQAQPLVSTLNSFHGGVVANAAIVPAGANGSVNVYVTDRTDVILDVNGYFEPSSGFSFYALDPCRVSDTRAGMGFFGALGPPASPAGSTRFVPLPTGVCGLPASASAYSLNVTVVPPGPLGYLTIWPTGQTQPFVSTLNSFDGAVVANAAIVPAGTAGAVTVYVTDATDIILDTNGYFGTSGGQGALSFEPLPPCRVVDTRVAGPVMQGASTRTFALPGTCGIPADAKAYSLNVTVVPTGPLGFLTLWPAGKPRPLVSTLNSFLGRVVANAAIVPAGANGAISSYVTDDTHVILDINGFFR